MRILRYVLSFAIAFASIAPAQSLPILTRATAPEINDSTLLLVSIASPFRTRAVSLGILKTTLGVSYPLLAPDGSAAAPSYSFANATGHGMFYGLGDTLSFSTGGQRAMNIYRSSATQTRIVGPSGTNTILAFQTHANSGALITPLQLIQGSGSGAIEVPDAAGTCCSIRFGNATTTGFSTKDNGTSDTLVVYNNNTRNINIMPGYLGFPSNSLTISARDGASRTITFQTTTSAQTLKNSLVLGADSSATFLGRVRLADSLVLAASGAVIRNNANGDMTIRSGNGANSSLTLKVTNSGGSEFSALNVSASSAGTQLKTFTLGSAAFPIYSSVDGNDGLYFAGNSGDTTAIANAGASQIRFIGNKWIGGDASTTIQAGIGASRTLTLATTTSAGAVKNSLVLGADSSATFLGKIVTGGSGGLMRAGPGDSVNFYASGSPPTFRMAGGTFNTLNAAGPNCTNGGTFGINGFSTGISMASTSTVWICANNTRNVFSVGVDSLLGGVLVITATGDDTVTTTAKVRATALTAASGTPNTVCIDATSKQLLENAATSCVVSSLRFKNSVEALSPEIASRSLMALTPATFTYNSGGRRSIGLIAENVDSVDARLGFRDAEGRVNSYDQAGVIALLIATVQQQQRQIDSLIAAGRKKP